MEPEIVTVRCACGWEAKGFEDEVVAATIDHGHKLHNMTATREQVLAMAIAPVGAVEEGGPTKDRARRPAQADA